MHRKSRLNLMVETVRLALIDADLMPQAKAHAHRKKEELDRREEAQEVR
jgi:hypothetical protein